ncbi:MAG: exodeoxyribonuclease V subunit beta [Candidatus Sericytochromatia bacterium]
MSSKPLVQTLPLRGRLLLEAGAGAGKTWTLSHLVLRLLLETTLQLPEILVVTFTEAATAELRSRVRARLRQALSWAQYLNGQGPAPEPDALLQEQVSAQDAPRLAQALQQFEQVQITTIHGFCQQVLQGWPLLSGAGFAPELLTDTQPLLREALEDYWRRHLYPADHWRVRQLLELTGLSLDKLQALLRPFLGLPEEALRGLPAPPTPLPLHTALAEAEAAYQALRTHWYAAQSEVALLLADGALNQTSYGAKPRAAMLAAAQQYFAAPGLSLNWPERLIALGASQLAAKTKKGLAAPFHPFCSELEALQARCEDLRQDIWDWQLELHHGLFQQLRPQLQQARRQRNQLSFDDLLLQVHAALSPAEDNALAAALRQRYGAVLIDEFQDTDRVQYPIFERLFDPERLFCLIGDPKQSIYRFRGAELDTYLQVQAQPDTQNFRLGQNFRTQAELLTAVKALFSGSDDVFGLAGENIPFVAPEAVRQGPPELRGDAQPPLVLWQLEDPNQPKARLDQLVADGVAGEIARLLSGELRLGPPENSLPLGAEHLAVLVRTGAQLRLMTATLQREGIPCVAWGEASVLESHLAWELELLLTALSQPGRGALLRQALLTRLLGASPAQLQQLMQDEPAWEALSERFRVYHDRWQHQGLAAMWSALSHGEGLQARLAACREGERLLSELRHLLSLLLAEEKPHQSPARLLQAYRRLRAQPQQEAARQRLISERPAVRVLTIHRSKGLEFPVVFCPWLWQEPEPGQGVISCRDPESGQTLLWLGQPDDPEAELLRARQQRETRAEAVRLAYVALTRARERCYVSWIPYTGRSKNRLSWSPLGHLLGLAETPRDPAAETQALQQLLARAAGQIGLAALPPAPPKRLPQPPAPPLSLRTPPPAPRSRWRYSSFSALLAQQSLHQEALPQDPLSLPEHSPADARTEALLADEGDEAETADATADLPPDDALLPAHWRLPGGTLTGEVLHRLLEKLDFQISTEALGPWVRRELGAFPPLRDWADTLSERLALTLDTPLPSAEPGALLRLRDLAPAQRVPELDFGFSVGHCAAGPLQALLGELAPPQLAFASWRGLLRGQIDLVFCWRGRYYLVDYKSSRLGLKPEAYAPEALAQCMRQQGYHLQALIYSVALHRWLRQRLPGYRPETHLGGVHYLFLRGLEAETPRGIFYQRYAPDLITALDQLWQSPEAP